MDVSNNTTLYRLVCPNNNLTSLDLSQNTNLELLSCGNNDLSSLNLKNISPSTLSTFIATSNPDLTCIEVDDVTAATAAWTNIDPQTSFNTTCSQIVNIPDANFKNYLVNNSSINTNGDAEIQVSEANAFTGEIYCANLSINSLEGIEAFTGVTSIICHLNNLTALDVSQNTALQKLHCHYNQLTSLDVSQNSALFELRCFNNMITSLDVSNNTELIWLECNNNNMSSIELGSINKLVFLETANNQLSNLDVSNLVELNRLDCKTNSIDCIKVNQNQFNNIPQDWEKDESAIYSLDCN